MGTYLIEHASAQAPNGKQRAIHSPDHIFQIATAAGIEWQSARESKMGKRSLKQVKRFHARLAAHG